MNNAEKALEVSKKGFIKHIGGIDFKEISEDNFEFKSRSE